MDFHDALVGSRVARFVVVDPSAFMQAVVAVLDTEKVKLSAGPVAAVEWFRLTGEILNGVDLVECNDPERLEPPGSSKQAAS